MSIDLPDRKVDISQTEKELKELKSLFRQLVFVGETDKADGAPPCCGRLYLRQFGIEHTSRIVSAWPDNAGHPYDSDDFDSSYPGYIKPEDYETEFAKTVAKRISVPMYECTTCGAIYVVEEAAKLPEEGVEG